VRVLVVVGGVQGELRRLGPPLDREAVGLPLLLARDRREVEVAELEGALDPEEALPSADELRGRLEKDVSRLDALDDLILVAGVLQLHLVLVVELVVRVPVDVDLQLVPDRPGNAEPQVLFEVGIELRGVAGPSALLVVFAVLKAGVDVGLSVDAKVDLGLAENGGKRTFAPAGHRHVHPKAAALIALLAPLLRNGRPVVPKIGPVGLPLVDPRREAHRPVGVEVGVDRIVEARRIERDGRGRRRRAAGPEEGRLHLEQAPRPTRGRGKVPFDESGIRTGSLPVLRPSIGRQLLSGERAGLRGGKALRGSASGVGPGRVGLLRSGRTFLAAGLRGP